MMSSGEESTRISGFSIFGDEFGSFSEIVEKFIGIMVMCTWPESVFTNSTQRSFSIPCSNFSKPMYM